MKEQKDISNNYVILLAEDDVDDQDMLMEMLKEEEPSIEFVIANTGSKALDMLKNFPECKVPCLIVLDYNLPEVSGAEILERMKQFSRFDKIIKVVWSTSNSPIYQKKCLDLGAAAYIVKPTGIAGIRNIARQMLALCKQPA